MQTYPLVLTEVNCKSRFPSSGNITCSLIGLIMKCPKVKLTDDTRRGNGTEIEATQIYPLPETQSLYVVQKKLAKQSPPQTARCCAQLHHHPLLSQRVLPYPAEIWVCESFGHSTCKNSDSQNSPQDSKAVQKKLPSTWGVHLIRSLLYPGEGGQPRLRVAKPREEMLGVWGNQGSCCGTSPNHWPTSGEVVSHNCMSLR